MRKKDPKVPIYVYNIIMMRILFWIVYTIYIIYYIGIAKMRNKDPLGKVKGTDAMMMMIIITIHIIILYIMILLQQQQHALINEGPRELVLLSFF